MTTNQTILDLNKVQHGTFYYRNQYGQKVQTKPTKPTVRRAIFDTKAPCFMSEGLTMLQYAKKEQLLDIWEPVVQFQLTANHNIIYLGAKAKAMWKAWNEKIFNKRKKQMV